MENTAKVFYEQDCDLSLLYGKTIAVIGYGSQGHAHALNAKESSATRAESSSDSMRVPSHGRRPLTRDSRSSLLLRLQSN